jgi:branched-chain amino acid transport system substrate-binding protein
MVLRYVSNQKPGAKVALLYSDSEYGRDPIAFARKLIPKMKLNLVEERVEKIGAPSFDGIAEALKLIDPDYVIVHGFVGRGIPEIVKKCRTAGVRSQFVGTFWEMNWKGLQELGQTADGVMQVSPYSRWWMEDLPMIQKIRAFTTKNHPGVNHRPNHYMCGFTAGLVFVEVIRRADKADKLNYDGMVEALKKLEDFDTGGLTAPLSCYNNSFPYARIWKLNASKGRFEPETDWASFRLKRQLD